MQAGPPCGSQRHYRLDGSRFPTRYYPLPTLLHPTPTLPTESQRLVAVSETRLGTAAILHPVHSRARLGRCRSMVRLRSQLHPVLGSFTASMEYVQLLSCVLPTNRKLLPVSSHFLKLLLALYLLLRKPGLFVLQQ